MNFNKRANGSWTNIPHYIHNTSTDTLTTLPADIYANDTTATVGLKGNMEQSSQPSPTTPIQPSECGDLETTGEHAGQYKIPISSANTTTPVYLGEVETTRKVKKLVLTGEENWSSYSGVVYLSNVIDYLKTDGIVAICTHYQPQPSVEGVSETTEGHITFSKGSNYRLCVRDNTYTSGNAFKTYLAAQYAAGTPVTVWYVLATEETAVVNEPLMRISDYADTLSNVSIPVTAGGDTLSVGTTVQPSEVTVNYKGWHPVSDVHEKSRNLFDYNAYFDSVFTPYNEFFNYSSIQLVPNTTYTLSTSIAEYGTNPRNTAFIVATTNQTPTTASGGISNISPITITTENDGILRLYKRISGNGILPTKDLFDAGDWLMLNTGSTALPYEPYWK